jgi:hypothetical protein
VLCVSDGWLLEDALQATLLLSLVTRWRRMKVDFEGTEDSGCVRSVQQGTGCPLMR